jgi:hypothetical protein
MTGGPYVSTMIVIEHKLGEHNTSEEQDRAGHARLWKIVRDNEVL